LLEKRNKRGYKSIKNSDQLEALIDRECKAPGLKYIFIRVPTRIC